MSLFWTQGFTGTSLDQLSDAMGMKRPSMYNAFGDKQTIYRMALARFVGQLDAAVEATLLSEPNLKRGLISFYEGALRVYCSADPAPGCMMMCTAPAETFAHPQIGADLKALIERIDTVLARRIEQGQRDGDYPADEDSHLAAKMIQANLHSFALRARAGESFTSLLAQADYFVDKVCG